MDHQNKDEQQSIKPEAKMWAVIGLLITALLCYLVYYFHVKGKTGFSVAFGLLAAAGLCRAFFDINFFSCTPSLVGTLTGNACGRLDGKTKT